MSELTIVADGLPLDNRETINDCSGLCAWKVRGLFFNADIYK
jgi:hypothetical protein